jgi:hypothetical protein
VGLFELKISIGVVAPIAIGWLLFRRGQGPRVPEGVR